MYSLAALYAAISAGVYFYGRRFIRSAYFTPAGKYGILSAGDAGFMLLFGGLSVLTHMPYFLLPLTTLGDAHMHAGLPALSYARLSAFFSELAGFDLRYVTVPLLCSFLILAAVYRERIKRADFAGRAVCILLLSGVIYIAFVLYYSPFERFGELEHFFRYPLLGKLVYFGGYSVFGVHEWVGRVSQIIFLLAGAVYFSRLLSLISSRNAARCGYAAFLMFPPFWNYGHHNYLEAGVIFFAAASMYYLLLYLKTSDSNSLLLFIIFCTTAVIYKEYLLGLLPISAAVTAGYNFAERRLNKAEWLMLGGGLVFPGVIALQYSFTFNYLKSVYDYYPSPVRMDDIFSYERLMTSFINIPGTISAFLAALSAAGLAFGIKKFRSGTFYMLLWFLVFWVLISASTGYAFPRTNLIFYIPLCAFICFFAGSIKRIARYMPGAVFALFAYISLFFGPGETVSFFRIGRNIYPYDELFGFIKEEEIFQHRVYAPMICEPSHFYIAKHNILKTDFLDRRGWEERAGSLEEFLRGGGYRYIVMPEGPLTDEIFSGLIGEDLQAELLEGGIDGVELYKSFYAFGRNYIYLFKVSP